MIMTEKENTLIHAHHISYKKILEMFALSLNPIIYWLQNGMKKESSVKRSGSVKSNCKLQIRRIREIQDDINV